MKASPLSAKAAPANGKHVAESLATPDGSALRAPRSKRLKVSFAPSGVSTDVRAEWEESSPAQTQLLDARDYAEAIIETVPPLLILDEKLRVKTANASFCSWFRIAPDEAMDVLVYELGNGSWNIPKLRTMLEEILPRKSFFKDFEVTHDFPGLGRRTVLLSGRQVDHLKRILLFIEDITERRGTQSSMRASEIRYRRLFEAARDGILILDPKTRKITDSNPFMSELLGYSREELVGKELWEIGLLKDEKASQEAFRELQQNHFVRYEDLPLQSKAGKRHEVEFVSNIYEEDGRKVIQCNIRDITERKRIEVALAVAREEIGQHAMRLEQVVAERTTQLRETVQELEAFSYSVSHDMRAPLRAMQSYSHFLLDEYGSKLDEQGVQYLQQIKRSSVRLDSLIRDVLSYTRILHHRLPVGSVNLDRLVRDIVEIHSKDQLIKAEIEIRGELPMVMGNEALLTQCISNVLSNALKFVATGITPHLEIWTEEQEASMVRLWFKDNGLGIAPENHERIFKMFERIYPTTEYEGTGIGLTIFRKAAERMGAQVGFESELGHGSRFWIELKKG
ncbi:MAG: PAS domain S-box protein [Akkermansiaceae bacterium]|nr:PAS domain S-box protein [Verrucomicrobiales bacterium]